MFESQQPDGHSTIIGKSRKKMRVVLNKKFKDDDEGGENGEFNDLTVW